MAEIEKLPFAHLVSPDSVHLSCGNLIEMLEKRVSDGTYPLTFLDRQNKECQKTAADLLEGARVFATYLKNRGLKKGDKVIILLLTSEYFTNSFFGTILAGGIPVPASPPMTFGDISKYLSNLRHILKNSEARYMITFPRIRKVIGGVLSDNNDLEELILAKDVVAEEPRSPGFPSIDPKDPAFFQYTSGTTNLPKGVVLTHRALLSNAYGIGTGIAIEPTDVGVSWLPLFHDMGLIGGMISAIYNQARLVSMMPEAFVMDPASWLKNVTRYKGTVVVAPNFAYHLCANRVSSEDMASLDLSTLKVALNGAEPIDLKTMDLFERKFAPVGFRDNVSFPVYGMAENCLAATFPRIGNRFDVEPIDRARLETEGAAVDADGDDPFPFQAVSVGFPLAGQEIVIAGQNGSPALEREVGEILVKSPSLMQGYYHNEEETAKVIKGGWLHTGDLGFVYRERLFITGRAKEMIIKRGRNYYPYDIERAASEVKGVRKGCLAAFAIPNGETGTEDLVLVCETRETEEQRKQQIEKAIASEVLGAIGAKPDHVLLVPPRSIPKTSSGKLQRLLCRQRYLDGTLVKGVTERWLTPVKTLVGSFLGHQRFRLRARNP
jgi:fatty-acyl-CoA synthase